MVNQACLEMQNFIFTISTTGIDLPNRLGAFIKILVLGRDLGAVLSPCLGVALAVVGFLT